jgi:hypothetical protein
MLDLYARRSEPTPVLRPCPYRQTNRTHFRLPLFVVALFIFSTSLRAHAASDVGYRQISFRHGHGTVIVRGRLSLSPGAEQRLYLLRARTGQTLALTMMRGGAINMMVHMPNGQVYGALGSFSMAAPESGPYRVVLDGADIMDPEAWSGPFTLKISLQ